MKMNSIGNNTAKQELNRENSPQTIEVNSAIQDQGQLDMQVPSASSNLTLGWHLIEPHEGHQNSTERTASKQNAGNVDSTENSDWCIIDDPADANIFQTTPNFQPSEVITADLSRQNTMPALENIAESENTPDAHELEPVESLPTTQILQATEAQQMSETQQPSTQPKPRLLDDICSHIRHIGLPAIGQACILASLVGLAAVSNSSNDSRGRAQQSSNAGTHFLFKP